MAQKIKNLPAMWETQVQFLGWEDVPPTPPPPEKGLVAHSSVLAWRIPWTEEPGRQQPKRSQESDTTEQRTLPL